MITEYIFRKRNGVTAKVGLLVGIVVNGEIKIGYSLCCKDDEFDVDVALAIALIRALSPADEECPPSIWNDADDFALKCIHYFPDAYFTYDDEVAPDRPYEYIVEIG